MTSALYPYQDKAAIAIGHSSLPVLNSFDPGLGKSRVALEVIKSRGYRRVLILCPHSVVLVWQAEIKKWWPKAPPVMNIRSGPVPEGGGVFVVSYGAVSEASGRVADALASTEAFEATILDECHYLKNPKSNRAKRIFDLHRYGRLGWVHPMSGTPAPNNASELWPLLFHLRPDLIVSPITGKPMREGEFQNRYCTVKHIQVNGRHIEQITGSKNMPELRERLAPMLVKAKKRDVLPELPPLDFVVLPVDISGAAQRSATPHIAPQRDATQRFDELDDDAFLAQLAGGAAKSEIQQLGLAKIPAVVEWVVDLIGDTDRRLVIWCMHHAVIDSYVDMLGEYQPVRFDGRDNLDQRRSAIERFMCGDAKIFVGQIQAGGTGLTLISKTAPCSDVVFAESSYSPSDNYQAACRIHRIGQNDGVLVRFACASGTLDDRIQEILARKARDLAEIFA